MRTHYQCFKCQEFNRKGNKNIEDMNMIKSSALHRFLVHNEARVQKLFPTKRKGIRHSTLVSSPHIPGPEGGGGKSRGRVRGNRYIL